MAAGERRGRTRGRAIWGVLAAGLGAAAILGAVIMAGRSFDIKAGLDREDFASIEEVERRSRRSWMESRSR